MNKIIIALLVSTLNIMYVGGCLAENVCVFCSSKDKIAQIYKSNAYELGKELAINNIGLVTGGRNTGIMKLVIDGHASIKTDAPRYAVIPKSLKKQNVLNHNIPKNNIIWTNDLHDRLKIFYTKCNIIIVMPGGLGAMHELMDSIENRNFGVIKKHIYILNTANFWGPTLKQFDNMVKVNAQPEGGLNNFKVVTSNNELLKELSTIMHLNNM